MQYQHHPNNPASAIMADEVKKKVSDVGAVQAELLAHGVKVRPDFHIIHMNLPNYSTTNMIVGGKAPCEELWQIYQCQYYLDSFRGNPEKVDKSLQMNTCPVFCKRQTGNAGINCKPLHRRIGQLLGYTEEQVKAFLDAMPGYDHLPDIHYPFELPPSLKPYVKKS